MGHTLTFKSRHYFGAKLEPRATVLHGAGQDIDSFLQYGATLQSDQQPMLYMTYTSITHTVDAVQQWQQRLTDELARIPYPVTLQIGLNMTGGNDTGEGRDQAVAAG